MRCASVAIAVALSVFICVSEAVAAPEAPMRLRTEYLENPLGIDTPAPRFGWWMRDGSAGAHQTAYQIQAATAPGLLAEDKPDVWDSGKVESNKNVHVAYAGAPLASFTRYHWRVRLWDGTGAESPWSEAAWFETALLEGKGEWGAKWIRCIEDLAPHNGYHTERFDKPDVPQWVEVDLGAPVDVAAVVLYPARPFDWKRDEPGFGFPLRYTVTVSKTPGKPGAEVVADRAGEDQPTPGEPVRFDFAPRKGQFVRLNVSRLRGNGEGKYLFALAEMAVFGPEGASLAEGSPVQAATSLDEGAWHLNHLVNGVRESRRGRRTPPLFRKAFEVAGPVAEARAYASGLGYYELYLNGERVGDHVLDPGNTVHQKRTLYSTYDVTGLLQQGANAAGFMVGHGWWKRTCSAWLNLRIVYEDGRVETVVTDESWKWRTGPVVAESLYHGETYDARKEVPGWNAPGLDEAGWTAAALLDNPPATMDSQAMPPIRVVEEIPAQALNALPGGSVIADFGQNLTGWIRLRVQGEPGAAVTMKHAELLYDDGRLNMENLRAARATDKYILKGQGEEVYAPRFTQHGFRYAEIIGYPGELTKDKLVAEVVHTDFERAGAFECSNNLYNSIRDLTLWSIRGNNMSIPTDCPQRDERMGWMGDAHLAAETSILNYDFAAYYANWLRVIANSQDEAGHVPDTAPHIWGRQDGSPPWAIAYPLITWYVWRYYADERAVAEHYANIVRWFGTLEAKAKDGVLEYTHYGDWVGVEKTDMPPIGTGCYYWTAELLEEFARVLGKEEDRKQWAGKKAAIAEAYNRAFWNQEAGCYENGTQFAQIFPLYLGIAGGHAPDALGHLKREILERRRGHLATGILGAKYVFDVLTDSGNVDIAYTVSLQEDYPSWGYMLAHGATTLWELWKLETGRGMNSHNHQMFGSIVDWFFGDVAGINKLPSPGYAQFTIAPRVEGPLEWAKAHVDTVRGRAASAWEKTENGLDVTVTIPPNSTARVRIPRMERELANPDEVPSPIRSTAGHYVFNLGAGVYSFELR